MTTVKFIGLFVLMYTQNVGYRILMPEFRTPMPMQHPSFIAYLATTRTSGADDWPGAQDVPTLPGWKYVTVNREYITFDGATDGVPNKVDPPHLTCCCATMNGIQPGFIDPNLPPHSKKGAQVAVTRGNAQLVQDTSKRLDTNVTMTTVGTTGITVTGTLGKGNVKKLYFQPAATVIFGNTPFCTLNNSCPPHEDADWVAYYSMANNSQNRCLGTPGNCEKCKTSGSGGPCTSTTCPSGGTQSMTMAQRIAAANQRKTNKVGTINIDCSNSQWP